MTLHVALNHQSRYEYDRAVQMGPQSIRLRPAPHNRTPILSYALKIEPEQHLIHWQQDPHGNFVAHVVYPEKVKRFFVEVDLVADIVARDPLDFWLEPEAESHPFAYEPHLRKDLEPYLAAPPAGQLLAKWLRSLRALPPQPTVTFLVELNRRLQSEIQYTARHGPGVQSPEETLTLKSGSARDSGWLLAQLLRHLGIASRFVSGYLIQLVPDVKPPATAAAPADFTDLHAWAEAYVPGAGWIGLDPTAGGLAAEGHIPLACTPHPAGAEPIAGLVEECETRFEHAISVRRAVESPRVTKPYSEEHWRAIDGLGRQLDEQLARDDVRVALGARPTFVAARAPEASEHDTTATVPAYLAADFAGRLRARFADRGGFEADGQPGSSTRAVASGGMFRVAAPLASNWDELRRITEGIYEDAVASGLVAERFDVDGRHVGTGGGQQVVLGAATAADSPFVRRPDLLASLITYWQHRPSLSYLFSRRVVGPASDAPRVDQARHDALHELELALEQAARTPPGSQRLFREVLVDAAGNAEHAEIYIEDPDRAGSKSWPGRVELRAFEMPPHPRMSLAQQLLVLAIVARCWRVPYRHGLIRWGAQLHDRFMLPHYVWADFVGVIDDLRQAGLTLDSHWFAPHYDFRFPLCGTVSFGGIELELREALEPQFLLGARRGRSGAAGGIDSSLERLQVKLRGIADGRYVVACNGARVPLAAAGDAGELVGAVRYRVPSSRGTPADAPLVFDLYDRWSRRAVAGCTYYVAHPTGRSFAGVPGSLQEAESRRLARFVPFGHTPSEGPEPREVPHGELPHTLDLRWTR